VNHIKTEAEYQRLQREQCDPPLTLGNLALAIVIVAAWLGLTALLEGSL
jgi:hypothetical protein